LASGVPSALLKNRMDVQQAEKEFVAAKYDFKSTKGAFYPSINITASVGANAFKSALWFDPASLAYNVLGGISAPLLNRPGLMNNYRNAYAAKNEAFLKYQKTVLTSVEEVSTEMYRLQSYQKVSSFKAEEVKTMNEAVSISNELFVTGYANYMEVLIARQNRLNSELELTEARKQQFISTIFLYKALGGGW
jgi:multidrug efflux system outer membrane protein